MTNLIECITSLVLVTNVTTEYPKRMETAPCPDGMIGCLVMHYREVPVENPQQRWVVTKIRELELVALPSLGITNTRSDRLVSETRQEQHTVVTWQDGAMVTNSVSNAYLLDDLGGLTNSTSIEWSVSGTNAIFLDLVTTNLGWMLDDVPLERLRDELKRREEKK